MSKLWDDLKKNMKDWGSAAVEKAEEVSKIAVAKTEELTRISKIKIEIHQLYRDLNKSFENLGRLSHRHARDDNMVNFTGNTDFYSHVQRIDDIQRAIEDKEAGIENIKQEYDIKEEDIVDISPKDDTAPADSGDDGSKSQEQD